MYPKDTSLSRAGGPRSRARRKLLSVLAGAAATSGHHVFAAKTLPSRVHLDLQRDGLRLKIKATATTDSSVEALWATLVDYERLPRFIPGMVFSKVLSRQGNAVTLHQMGEAGWGPFSRRIELVLAIMEDPPTRISAVAIGGDAAHFEARYELVGLPTGEQSISYVATIEPKLPLPPLVGTWLVRRQMQAQFEALVVEAERVGRLGDVGQT